jgi:Ca-activated chloride channel homolog
VLEFTGSLGTKAMGLAAAIFGLPTPSALHRFEWPAALYLLLLLPLLVGLYVLMQMRRRRYAMRYASVSLLREAVGSGPGVRRHIPAAIYLLALTAMIFALARPQGLLNTAYSTGIVILAIDVSGSMIADDVEPTRMEATKRAVREFVERQPRGVQIGVVSFSDFGALVQAPTREKKPVIDAINRLQPQRGTNMGGGLQAALDAIYEGTDGTRPAARTPFGLQPTPTPPSADANRPPPASIVLLSDGQSNTGPPPVRVAEEAVDAGVKIYTVGIGTPEGTIIRVEGRNVFTRLDDRTLQEIADMTGGEYFSAQDESELRRIYEQLARERQTEEEETELTFVLTGLALFLSLIGGALSLAWFNRLP